jgi:hypothetical protein
MMRSIVIAAMLLVILAALPPPAFAQRAPAANKPYKPVAVTLPEPSKDRGLAALRAQLATIAQKRDRAALARITDAKSFFWERDFGGGYEAKKSPIENLTAALGLDRKDNRGWSALARFASEPTLGPIEEQEGALCAPADPDYEDAELAALMDATNSDVVDWSYPRKPGLQARAAPATSAQVVETLGADLVRVLGFEGKPDAADPTRTAWTRIATPGGKTAYVPPDSLLSPLVDRLCFRKDAAGTWRIVGYVGGGD